MSLSIRYHIVFIMEMFKDGMTDKDYYFYKVKCKMKGRLTPTLFEKIMQECRDMTTEEFNSKLESHKAELKD